MVQSEELRQAFVKRLKDALAAEKIPEWGVGARLAEKTHKTAKAASKWLNGESMPSRANMIAIAEWLNVRVEWLAHGEGEMRPGQTRAASSSERVAIGMALFNKATPRSQALIKRINELDAQGKLAEEDLELLEQFIERFAASK